MPCSKIDSCFKIKMIQDKDIPEPIMAKFIQHACKDCTEGKNDGNQTQKS
jgi:hypothetical protein